MVESTKPSMRVLVADQFSADGIKELQAAEMEVTYDAGLNGESLTKALGELHPNVLVVRSTKVTAADVNADPKLQLVVRAGVGYDTIDVAQCAASRVFTLQTAPGRTLMPSPSLPWVSSSRSTDVSQRVCSFSANKNGTRDYSQTPQELRAVLSDSLASETLPNW